MNHNNNTMFFKKNLKATLHTAIDIFAFGMCALETAALELLPANPPNSSANAGSASNGPKDPKGIFYSTYLQRHVCT